MTFSSAAHLGKRGQRPVHLSALLGFTGFAGGILAGVFFLNWGYSLRRTYRQPGAEGAALPAVMLVLLALLAAAPGFIRFTEAGGGPGALHAAPWISLVAGFAVDAAFAHNFGLASSGTGPTQAGKIAVLIGITAEQIVAVEEVGYRPLYRAENSSGLILYYPVQRAG